MADALADAGPLARAMPAFEPREGQRRMAAAVAAAIEHGGVLLAEAGTGTGKTLAYLVPALLSGQRVLVSTGTKNLQDQIVEKDLPDLQDALGLRFRVTCMKGRGNYLCRHRFDGMREAADAQPALLPTRDRALLDRIAAWAERTRTGDRAEIVDLPDTLPLWRDIAASSENCIGTDCPAYDQCYVTTMRQQAAESHLVIVNHHLLCADAAVRQSAYGEVIPPCAAAVIDEAHQLEDVTTHYFGQAVSARQIEELDRDGRRIAAAADPAEEIEEESVRELLARLDAVRNASRTFFAALAETAAADGERVRVTADQLAPAARPGAALRTRLAELANEVPDLTVADAAEDLAALGRRTRDLRDRLAFLMAADDPAYVYFLERRTIETDPRRPAGGGDGPRGGPGGAPGAGDARRRAAAADTRALRPGAAPAGGASGGGGPRDGAQGAGGGGWRESADGPRRRRRTLMLRAAPVDVSGIVREMLVERMESTILTSATLTVDDSFAYLRERLGIAPHHPGGDAVSEIRVPSEFDYREQAILYLPPGLPPPHDPQFAPAVAQTVAALLRVTEGRAFVLFTSYANLRRVQARLAPDCPYPLLVQGSAPRAALIEEFRTTPHAVLLATASFWQGVDVAGEALSCVVIDKLPFEPPNDPVTAARMEQVEADGGRPFDDYQVPMAMLALAQGIGRLLRHREDRGVIALLDPRLRTKRYGQRFLDALPPAPVTDDLADVAAFFRAGHGGGGD